MAINNKTQNETKILLKTALLEGLDISMFKDNILSGKPPTEEFNTWFYERIELQRLFIEFKNNPTNKRKDKLNQYVAFCGYSDIWIESIIKKLNICIDEAKSKDEEAEEDLLKAEAEKGVARKEAEYKRKAVEAESYRLEQLKKEQEEPERIVEAKVEAETYLKEIERQRLEQLNKEQGEQWCEQIDYKFCNKCGTRMRVGGSCPKCRDVAEKEKAETEKKKKSKFCRACGKPVEKESKECPKCGTRLDTKQCRNPNCRKIISEISVFCPYCSSLN